MLKEAIIDGLWRRNVASVQLLGLCPLLAVSYNIENAIGLSIASSFVLVGSSSAISAVRQLIPQNIRLPCFVLVIATLTTLVTMFMQAFAWELYMQVALFVQIIVTNCMILGHVESFASKQPVLHSLVNAITASFGFSIALILLGTVRQSFHGLLPIVQESTGAFLVAGLMLALINAIAFKLKRDVLNVNEPLTSNKA